MQEINGIFFTGGSLDIHIDNPINGSNLAYNIYTFNSKIIFDIAIKMNKNGIYFPIWGTCQGMQLLSYIVNDF